MLIIDANNLAGAVGILFNEKFDEKLIDIIKEYNKGKNEFISLVFDGADLMGDRFQIDKNLEVIYTPRDSYYKSADDKIIELVKVNCRKSGITVISNDLRLSELCKETGDEEFKNVKIMKASQFAKILKQVQHGNKKEIKKNRDLDEREKKEIDEELMKLWVG